MRVAQNPANRPFVEWLLRIGEPTVSSGTTTDYGKIPDECLFQPPDLIRANNSPAKGIYPNIETTGIQANLFNAFDNQATKMLHGGKVKIHFAQDSVPDPKDAVRYSAEYLHPHSRCRISLTTVSRSLIASEFDVRWQELCHTYGDNDGSVSEYLQWLYDDRFRWA
ncbi:hypothetical protein EDD21DRAFT_351030 [Dissophora ornata]|nr:hypothetical protein EDD21DRAFT_351030 [Dissophora ornata]